MKTADAIHRDNIQNVAKSCVDTKGIYHCFTIQQCAVFSLRYNFIMIQLQNDKLGQKVLIKENQNP